MFIVLTVVQFWCSACVNKDIVILDEDMSSLSYKHHQLIHFIYPGKLPPRVKIIIIT